MPKHSAETGDLTGHLAAVLTPPGRGAIASIVIQGPNVRQAVARWFHPNSGQPLDRYAPGRIVLGQWRSDAATSPGEQLIVQCSDDGHIEVHCHGGRAAVVNILDSLRDAGCGIIDSASWLLGQHSDRLAAEAHLALSKARTLRTASILLDQLNGALLSAARAVRAEIELGQTVQARREIERLLDLAKVGLHLTEPWRIVVAGRPNAGKSTLVNAMLGYSRCIVHEQPGTTRDVLTADTAIDGWPVEITDTAGLHVTQDAIESAGIESAIRQFTAADVVVWVRDGTQPWRDDDASWLNDQRSPVIVVHNKSDLATPLPDQHPAGLLVSARQGSGLQELLCQLANALVPSPPEAGSAVPFLDRHLDLLRQTIADLGSDHLAAALARIDRLVIGE